MKAMNNEMPRYTVYTRHKNHKRAYPSGIYTDDLERAKDIADRQIKSWWGQNGVFLWVKVKDCKTGKYIYTAQDNK